MKIESLTDLFIEELRDLYDAENQLLKALPRLAEAAFSEDLRETFETHTEETKTQIGRIETIFQHLKLPAQGRFCHGMAGLLKESEELIKSETGSDPNVMDAGLVVAAQKVEHYEIAGYGSARTFANTLGAQDAEKLLQATLDEENATDRKLTTLAQTAINLDAGEADSEIFGQSTEEEHEAGVGESSRSQNK